jgi:hypothetical protein
MSLHEFLHAMGLPVSDPAEAPIEAPVAALEQKVARLDDKLKRLYRALLRRRLRIERLRFALKREGTQSTLSSAERAQAKIEKHEAAYRRLLVIFGQSKQRLAHIQVRIRTMTRARI